MDRIHVALRDAVRNCLHKLGLILDSPPPWGAVEPGATQFGARDPVSGIRGAVSAIVKGNPETSRPHLTVTIRFPGQAPMVYAGSIDLARPDWAELNEVPQHT